MLAGCFLALGTATASRVPAKGNPPPDLNVKSKVQKRKPPPKGSGQTHPVCGEMTEDIDTDLTGTEFRGTVLYPAAGIDQRTAATLVINETDPTSPNRTFTLTAEGKPPLSGLFSARTTCGYTGAAMRFDGSTLSVRACREGGGTAFRSSEAEGFDSWPTMARLKRGAKGGAATGRRGGCEAIALVNHVRQRGWLFSSPASQPGISLRGSGTPLGC